MKLNKKTAGAVIFILLVLLLFFSNTIYTYNMPVVTAVKPARGTLNKLEITSGVASWADTENIYSASAGTVGRVYVREGDRVIKDQILFEMDFNITAAERQLSEINNNITKLEADIRSLSSRLNNIRSALYTEDTASLLALSQDTGAQMAATGLIALEIYKSRIALESARLTYEFGFLSRNELISYENDLKSTLLKYETDVLELEHSIMQRQIDMANLRISRDNVREILSNFRNNMVIRAPSDGTILDLNAERGKYYNENALFVSIGIGNEFIIECDISLDNNFVNPGDICELSNVSHMLKGTVRRVRPSANAKTAVITVVSDEISDGETFNITFEKTSNTSFTLVPNRAINQDNDGYFLYQIKRRRGILGMEYYIERLNIFIGDSDNQNTAIIRGLTFFEPILLASNKPLSAGMAVTLRNAEDFFEN